LFQAYSWALEGMKFVSILKMDECQTIDACRNMIREFDEYMQNHPPIPEVIFLLSFERNEIAGSLSLCIGGILRNQFIPWYFSPN